MDLSFHEKSILGSLVITVVLFSGFFIAVFGVLFNGNPGAAHALPFVLVGVVVAVIVVEVAYHIAIASLDKPADEDERDKLIEAKATRIAYFVLVTAILTIAGHAMFNGVFLEPGERGAMQNPVMLASLIVCSFILSEIAGFATQLYYYRRGV